MKRLIFLVFLLSCFAFTDIICFAQQTDSSAQDYDAVYEKIQESSEGRDKSDYSNLFPYFDPSADMLNDGYYSPNDYIVTDFEICKSFYYHLDRIIYNPHFDYGFALPSGASWYALRDEYTLPSSYTNDQLINYSDPSLAELPVISDFSVHNLVNNSGYDMYISVRNVLLDDYYGNKDGISEESCVQTNMKFLEDEGYSDICRIEDLQLGDDRYQIACGDLHKYGSFHHRRLILSHIVDDTYIVEFDLQCISNKQYKPVLKRIFNAQSKPAYSDMVKNMLNKHIRLSNHPERKPSEVRKWIESQDEKTVKAVNIAIFSACAVVAYILAELATAGRLDGLSPRMKREIWGLAFGGILMILVLTLLFSL